MYCNNFENWKLMSDSFPKFFIKSILHSASYLGKNVTYFRVMKQGVICFWDFIPLYQGLSKISQPTIKKNEMRNEANKNKQKSILSICRNQTSAYLPIFCEILVTLARFGGKINFQHCTWLAPNKRMSPSLVTFCEKIGN